jgi:predicted membrane protein
MYNKHQVFLGIAIVLAGVMFLIGNIFDVDVGSLCCPVALIAAGILLLMRPQLLDSDTPGRLKLLGDVRRRGAWQVSDEELWVGIGDVRLDMTDADVPVGETRIRVFSFVGNVRVLVPEGVGIAVSSTAFVTDVKVLGRKGSYLATPFERFSDGYEAAERRVRVDVFSFVGSLQVKRGQIREATADFSEQQESSGGTPAE